MFATKLANDLQSENRAAKRRAKLAKICGCAMLCVVAISPLPATAAPPETLLQSPQTLRRIWLSDLPESNVSVDSQFGKQGSAGAAPGGISIRGIASHFGLGWQAEGHVEYALGKKYRTFRTSVALNDTAGGETGRPIEFRVFGDGKLLWNSSPLYHAGGGLPCMIDITGVEVLRLEVRFVPNTTGNEKLRHAVWDDPYVSETAVLPSELALYSPEAFARKRAQNEARTKVSDAFAAGRYSEIETLFKEWRKNIESDEAQFTLEFVYDALDKPTEESEEGWKKHFARLEQWKAAQPDAITPLVALGCSYINYAWAARGTGTANEVSNAAMAKFEERLKLAREPLEQAQAKGEDTQLYRCLIILARAEGTPLAAKAPFEKGRKLNRGYYGIYAAMAAVLLPQWYGQPGDVEKFATLMRKDLGGELGDEMYFQIACAQYDDMPENFYRESGFKYEDLLPGILSAVRRHPESDVFVNLACHMACMAHDRRLAAPLLRRVDAATFSPGPWRSYARMEYWRGIVQGEIPDNQIQAIVPAQGWFGSIAFLGGSNRLIASGQAPALEAWDFNMSLAPRRMTVPPGVSGMAVDNGGSTALVRWGAQLGKPNTEAMVYFLKSPDPPLELKGHTAEIVGQAMSGDGKRCATSSLDKTAKIWNLADPKNPIDLKHPRPVFKVAFSADGKTVATTDFQGVVRLWNSETGASLGEPLGEQEKSHGKARLSFLPGGDELITGADDGTIRRWNIQARTFREIKLQGDALLTQIAVSPDGKWLAVGRSNGALDFFDLDGLKLLHTRYGHFQAVYGLAFSPDNKTLATSSLDGAIKFWWVAGLAKPSP